MALDGPDSAIDRAAGLLYNRYIMATQQINFRLTLEERDGFIAAAGAMGMNQSEFIKSAILHCRHCPDFEREFKRPRVSGRRGIRRLLGRSESEGDDAGIR